MSFHTPNSAEDSDYQNDVDEVRKGGARGVVRSCLGVGVVRSCLGVGVVRLCVIVRKVGSTTGNNSRHISIGWDG